MSAKRIFFKIGLILILLLSVLFILAIHTTSVEHPKFNVDLFDRNKSLFKTGVFKQADNRMLIQVESELPNVTPAMVAWWFEEYMQTSDHYKLWYPGAHLWMAWENKVDGEIIGASHLVDEYVGDSLAKLRIEFVNPSTMIPGYVESESRFAVCAFPGPREVPITVGIMCHDTQLIETGSIMRSVFHMGYYYQRDSEGNLTNKMPTLFNFGFVRSALLGEQFGNDLMNHAKTEMSILGRFLPSIYNDETSDE